MDLTQKIVLICWAVVVLILSTVLVPFESKIPLSSGNYVYSYFYAPIWTTKSHTVETRPASVDFDTSRWIAELFAVTVVAGTVFALLSGKNRS